MILLTDGRVMVQEEQTAHWHALTPDSHGSYLNGTWSTLKDMSFWRRYYASGTLKDGRVIVVGGEQSGDVGDTNKGEIYNPVSDSWTTISTPPWASVGDATGCILPDGRLMIGALGDGECIAYSPQSDTWSSLASASGRTNEETWVLLPDNTIITAQTFSPFKSEKYIIASDTWQDEGNVPVTLVDSVMNEIGPAMLLYNGKVIFFGAANSGGKGKTALYTPAATATGHGSWSAGPDIPKVSGKTIVSNDCPASLLPNGKVLFTGAPFANNDWGQPIYFFEYDPIANTITQAPTPANNGAKLFWSRMMLLPSGEVLFSPSSGDVRLYQPDSGPQEAWRPTIASVTATSGFVGSDNYVLTGTQLNGLSQANMYGDDCQPVTNYPLVRLRQPGTGNVYYARTHTFSTLGVATGGSLQSCHFNTASVPNGSYELHVVANGIESHPVPFTVYHWHKPEVIDYGVKREFEFLGKIIYEGDPFDRFKWIGDPEEIVGLRNEVRSLENTVKRLGTLIEARDLPPVGREIARKATAAEKRNGGEKARTRSTAKPKRPRASRTK
jgi:hypothetical protein